MQWQVIEQSAPGEPWRFLAHGARYGRAEAAEAVAAGERLGVRRKAIACGKARRAKRESGK